MVLKMRSANIFFIAMIIVSLCSCSCTNGNPPSENGEKPPPPSDMVYSMKGVGIDLPKDDFIEMQRAGIKILATEWGMEQDVNEVLRFLDQAQAAGLKVVMDGGFSYTAWGFTDDDWESLPQGKKPVWQKGRVQNWIKQLKDHPAISAWDICNEFGENLPCGAGMENSNWPQSMITIEQLKQARADVLAVDSSRPIHIRMYEWDCNDMPGYIKTLLNDGIPDIISLNLYSNYTENGNLQWPEIVKEAGPCCVQYIKKQSPATVVWISLAAFEEQELFQRPSPAELTRDIEYAKQINNINGISFFCWGPMNQWDPVNHWYLPQTGADLWEVIQRGIQQHT
jgi:hypothetical protein